MLLIIYLSLCWFLPDILPLIKNGYLIICLSYSFFIFTNPFTLLSWFTCAITVVPHLFMFQHCPFGLWVCLFLYPQLFLAGDSKGNGSCSSLITPYMYLYMWGDCSVLCLTMITILQHVNMYKMYVSICMVYNVSLAFDRINWQAVFYCALLL